MQETNSSVDSRMELCHSTLEAQTLKFARDEKDCLQREHGPADTQVASRTVRERPFAWIVAHCDRILLLFKATLTLIFCFRTNVAPGN